MENIIRGYRKMTGLTQREMAEKLYISEGNYRNKEKRRTSFKEMEMQIFYALVSNANPTVKISDIFFNLKPTKTDELEGGEYENSIRTSTINAGEAN